MMLFQILLDNGTQDFQPVVMGGDSFWFGWWIILVLFVAALLIYLAHRVKRLLTQPDLHGLDRQKILSTWQQIEHTGEQGIMGAKMAVIEADKLLDGVLKSMFLPGETMADRLKVAQYKYPAVQNVWGAHKLRNQLVHDASFEISPRQARRALKDFHDALKALNVL